jgi:hypothetical protein
MPRGTAGIGNEAGGQSGPDGSNLFATFYFIGAEQRADIEEKIGRTKRLLLRLEGENAHARSVAWMDGFLAGRDHAKRAPIVETTTRKRPK